MLVEKPKTVAVENFYNTAQEIGSAVDAIYEPLRSNNMVEQTVILDAHTDWGYGRGSRADYNAMQGFNAANINNAGSRWNAFYLAIRNANLVIQNALRNTSISPDDLKRHLGEARFLRAFAYFQLVRNWGSIPLRTEENMTSGTWQKVRLMKCTCLSMPISNMQKAVCRMYKPWLGSLPDIPRKPCLRMFT